MPNLNNRGVILFIVIGLIMVVSVLAIVMLRIISSQSRLTHHQVSRIQSQYAAKAGFLYAFDKLRRNDDPVNWPNSGLIQKSMCRNAAPGCNIIEGDLPPSIERVDIVVYDVGTGPSNTRKIETKAIYTYTP